MHPAELGTRTRPAPRALSSRSPGERQRAGAVTATRVFVTSCPMTPAAPLPELLRDRSRFLISEGKHRLLTLLLFVFLMDFLKALLLEALHC